MAFIYLMASAHNVIKIGLAKDVAKRRRTLQIGQPFDLKVLHRLEVSDDAALEVERAIHKRLKRYRIRGEWFRLERGLAISTAERVASQFAKDRTIGHPDDSDTALAKLTCKSCGHSGEAKVRPVHRHKFKCSKCGGREVAWRL